MNQPKPEPPSSALWLLHRFLPTERREALLGDLLEKFHQGRSSCWLWREVLIAVALSFGTTLRMHRAEVAFTILGTTLHAMWWTSRWWRMAWQSPMMQSLYAWGLGWPFPLSSAYDILFHSIVRLVLLLPLVAVFSSSQGGWRGARVLRAIGIGLALLTPGEVLVLLSRGSVYISMFESILFFLALLLSIWTSCTLRPSAPSQLAPA